MPTLSEKKKKKKTILVGTFTFVSIKMWDFWLISAVITEMRDSRAKPAYSGTASENA